MSLSHLYCSLYARYNNEIVSHLILTLTLQFFFFLRYFSVRIIHSLHIVLSFEDDEEEEEKKSIFTLYCRNTFFFCTMTVTVKKLFLFRFCTILSPFTQWKLKKDIKFTFTTSSTKLKRNKRTDIVLNWNIKKICRLDEPLQSWTCKILSHDIV